MYEPTGAFAAEIIESMAQMATQDAEDQLRRQLTRLLSDRLKLDPREIPTALISLLLRPISARQDRALTDLLRVMGNHSRVLTATDPQIVADELADLAKNIRQSFRQKRNQASYIKTVVRPLHSLWLKRWRLEREDFDFATVSARADRLNSTLITNEEDLDQWARDVLVFFHDTAVEPETSMETSKRPRGTVSEAGFRAYRLAWINFISENKFEILNRLRNDPAVSKSRSIERTRMADTQSDLGRPETVFNDTAVSPTMALKSMSIISQSNPAMIKAESSTAVAGNQIEVILQPDDPSTPSVARSWEFPAPDLVIQFQQWAAKLAPLLKLNEVPFNGTIRARTPWGDQEVKLTNATAADIDSWGTMMIQP